MKRIIFIAVFLIGCVSLNAQSNEQKKDHSIENPAPNPAPVDIEKAKEDYKLVQPYKTEVLLFLQRETGVELNAPTADVITAIEKKGDVFKNILKTKLDKYSKAFGVFYEKYKNVIQQLQASGIFCEIACEAASHNCILQCDRQFEPGTYANNDCRNYCTRVQLVDCLWRCSLTEI